MAIEEARQRDLLRLEAETEQARIDRRRSLLTANLEARSIESGSELFATQRQLRREQIEIDTQYYQDSINNSLKFEGEKGELLRAEARKQLLLLKKDRDDLLKQEKSFDIYRLILGEDYDNQERHDALDKISAVVVNSINEVFAAERQAAEFRANNATTAISELSSQLQAEIALRNEWAASNIAGLQNEITQQKRIRREALQDQRRAAQAQVIVDAITQASNIATAASDVFAAFAKIPYVGVPLGIAAAGVLVGAFAAAKVKAFSAASKIGGGGAGFFTGGYTGGQSIHEERGVVHGREFVSDHQTTAKFRHSLLEPLHTGQYQKIDWNAPAMQPLLASLPVPDKLLPARMHAEAAAVQSLQVHHTFGSM